MAKSDAQEGYNCITLCGYPVIKLSDYIGNENIMDKRPGVFLIITDDKWNQLENEFIPMKGAKYEQYEQKK